VWVHSNLDEVELFLNGKSQGSQKVPPLTHLEWKVKYEPGVIEARGSKGRQGGADGKARDDRQARATIKLTADRIEIDADGEDVAVLRVEVLDKEGRSVPTADNLINFKVTATAR
jgi:beta-galactosidase